MVRRLVLLLALLGVAWLIVSRLRRSAADDWDEDEPGDSWYGFAPPAGQAGSGVQSSVAGYAAAAPAPAPTATPDAYQPAVGASPGTGGAAATGEMSPPVTPADATATGARPVKGNVRADGEKIYHLPGDPAYERTNAETLFGSAEEAEAAGFRRAGRPRG